MARFVENEVKNDLKNSGLEDGKERVDVLEVGE